MFDKCLIADSLKFNVNNIAALMGESTARDRESHDKCNTVRARFENRFWIKFHKSWL